ncbi:MAG: hypothetical protein ABFD76_07730 [Smithella sp.]
MTVDFIRNLQRQAIVCSDDCLLNAVKHILTDILEQYSGLD